MLSRKIELLARTLQHPTTTKYQAESAGQSLLGIAREVSKLEQLVPEELLVPEGDAAPVPEAKDDTVEWLRQRYSKEELKDAYLEEHDHDRKWIPVRNNKVT